MLLLVSRYLSFLYKKVSTNIRLEANGLYFYDFVLLADAYFMNDWLLKLVAVACRGLA